MRFRTEQPPDRRLHPRQTIFISSLGRLRPIGSGLFFCREKQSPALRQGLEENKAWQLGRLYGFAVIRLILPPSPRSLPSISLIATVDMIDTVTMVMPCGDKSRPAPDWPRPADRWPSPGHRSVSSVAADGGVILQLDIRAHPYQQFRYMHEAVSKMVSVITLVCATALSTVNWACMSVGNAGYGAVVMLTGLSTRLRMSSF